MGSCGTALALTQAFMGMRERRLGMVRLVFADADSMQKGTKQDWPPYWRTQPRDGACRSRHDYRVVRWLWHARLSGVGYGPGHLRLGRTLRLGWKIWQ